MPTSTPSTQPAMPKPGPIQRAIDLFYRRRAATEIDPDKPLDKARTNPVRDDWGDFAYEPTSAQFLFGTNAYGTRHRSLIYAKWQAMSQDPIISSALKLHVTAALGGHEAKGEMVFVTASANAKKNPQLEKYVEEIAKDLQPILNRIAPTVAYNGILFGDAYGRVYADEGVGVRDVYVDEMVYPPLFQPFERANTTVGYLASLGARHPERLTVLQVARMRMPRMLYIPQDGVMWKIMRMVLRTDKIEGLPAVPSLAGGSFLDGAEAAYDRFSAAWAGLVGQRVQASVNESIVTVQQEGMTKEQSKRQRASLSKMLAASNEYVQKVVSEGRAVFNRIWHFVPVTSEKQLVRVDGQATSGLNAPFSTDDIMMHARFLAGALGVDLSMIGFADQLSGGLGDGGFFRTSAQAAERSRAIRQALTEFFDHIISVHLLMKHGISFDDHEKPWEVTYYSGISALEKERQATESEKANAFLMLTQILDSLKNIGLPQATVEHLLEKRLGLDKEDAKVVAEGLANAKPADGGDGGFGGDGQDGGGGDGGGFGGEGEGGGQSAPPAPAPPGGKLKGKIGRKAAPAQSAQD